MWFERKIKMSKVSHNLYDLLREVRNFHFNDSGAYLKNSELERKAKIFLERNFK